MKSIKLLLIIFFAASKSFAQTEVKPVLPTYKIGIFAPLYLDSLFSNGTLKYKQGIPKFVVPSLEFVQGAQVALDSIKIKEANIQAFVYDSKSYSKNIAYLIRNNKLDSLSLIIGHSRDADYKQLAEFALLKNIPFVSVTYPNDGGVTANPFTIIINSTLKAHCEGIYSYLLQSHPTDKLFLLRKKGTQEDKIANYFKAINEQDGKPLLNILTIDIDSNFNADALAKNIDSNRNTVLIGASLDENFAKNVALASYNIHTSYPLTLIGMPNWDGFSSLQKKDVFEDFPIYFTTPYFNTKWDVFSKQLIAAYAKKYKSKPSDMAYKGFEAVQLFTKLLVAHPNDFMSNLNDKAGKVFCDYNFKPVVLNKETSPTPDYFENKHLYFIKILNGSVSKAW
ncbi:MAG: ABC transporter substrate-binding protein [Chitinophagaceae bacterium]|nr:ABC transporter substrate-binding protein [Chitinophagaceae bacterium]